MMKLDRSTARAALATAVVLLLAAAQLAMVLQVPLRHHAAALYDETLFMQQAMHLARGEWLGPYTALTLAKGPGFSLWLAAVHTLRLPVNLAAALGWALACALLLLALRPALPALWPRVAVFALVLFTPEALGEFSLLRELIYPSLVLAVTASGLGLILRAAIERRAAWPWALALGLSSAALILTREEAVLMAPLWLVAALSLLRAKRTAAALTLGVALAAALLPLARVAVLNERHYGAYALVETSSRPFTTAVGALARVRHAATLPHVPVPRETWPRLAAASPAFAELKPLLEGEVGARWFGPHLNGFAQWIESDDAMRAWLAEQIDQALPRFAPGTAATHLRQRHAEDPAFRAALDRFLGGPRHAQAFLSGAMQQEIGGAFFIWALRDAAAARGHHADAAVARRFYARLASEVNAACSRATLDCRSRRSGLIPPLTRAHREALPAAFTMASIALLSSENHTTARYTTALGEAAALSAAEQFVHAKLAPPQTQMAAAQPMEALIVMWRWLLPLLGVAALGLWLLRPRAMRRALWLSAGLVLLLVLARLAMVALIHASAWPAAIAVRYLAPAQPLVLLFVGLVLVPTLVARFGRAADTAAPCPTPNETDR